MKESDRIEAMETELKKWGVDITSTFDSIQIHGKEHYKSDNTVEIFGHNDHRIVMAMTVLGYAQNLNALLMMPKPSQRVILLSLKTFKA